MDTQVSTTKERWVTQWAGSLRPLVHTALSTNGNGGAWSKVESWRTSDWGTTREGRCSTSAPLEAAAVDPSMVDLWSLSQGKRQFLFRVRMHLFQALQTCGKLCLACRCLLICRVGQIILFSQILIRWFWWPVKPLLLGTRVPWVNLMDFDLCGSWPSFSLCCGSRLALEGVPISRDVGKCWADRWPTCENRPVVARGLYSLYVQSFDDLNTTNNFNRETIDAFLLKTTYLHA